MREYEERIEYLENKVEYLLELTDLQAQNQREMVNVVNMFQKSQNKMVEEHKLIIEILESKLI